MPAIITSNQIYRPGETPVYVAYIYIADKSVPLQFDEIETITMSHYQQRDGLMNGRVVTSWFPVASDGEMLENISIQPSIVRDPIDISETDVFEKTTQVSLPDDTGCYNFIFIPLKGWNFYPNIGIYQTVFYVTLTNGTTENLIFQSRAVQDSDVLTIVEPEASIQYGQTIKFTGTLYAKSTDQGDGDKGKLQFVGKNNITNVYLSVSHVTGQMVDQRVIGVDTLSYPDTVQTELNPLLLIENPNSTQLARIRELMDTIVLTYQYNTNNLPKQPIIGMDDMNQYRFEFSIQVNQNDIICVFAIDVDIE